MTKKNHFVPQFYLKSFLNSSDVLYSKDLSNNNLYEHDVNHLARVAQKKNLYTVKNKIAQNDVDYFKEVFSSHSDIIANWFIDSLVMYLNDELSGLCQFKINKDLLTDKSLEYCNEIEASAKNFIKNRADTVGISRRQEDLFTFYESGFIPVFNDVLSSGLLYDCKERFSETVSNDIDFEMYIYAKFYQWALKELVKKVAGKDDIYADVKKNANKIDTIKTVVQYDFLHYVVNQFLRTNKQIVNAHDAFRQNDELIRRGVSKENFTFLNIHYLSILFGSSLLKWKYTVILVHNKSDIAFITSDSPCVNIHDSFHPDEMIQFFTDNDFELYFPLSPRYAILISNKDCYRSLRVLTVENNCDVEEYNKVMQKTAHRYIYSNSKELLD